MSAQTTRKARQSLAPGVGEVAAPHPIRHDTVPRRVRRFAEANGLLVDSGAAFGPMAASPFRFGDVSRRQHLVWLATLGPTGFEVGTLRTVHDTGDADNAADIATWTYAVFTLRLDLPDDITLDDPRMRAVLGDDFFCLVDARPKLAVELVGRELFVHTRRRMPLTAARTWRRLSGLQEALRPHLAQPLRTSGSGVRRRLGVRLELPATAVRREA